MGTKNAWRVQGMKKWKKWLSIMMTAAMVLGGQSLGAIGVSAADNSVTVSNETELTTALNAAANDLSNTHIITLGNTISLKNSISVKRNVIITGFDSTHLLLGTINMDIGKLRGSDGADIVGPTTVDNSGTGYRTNSATFNISSDNSKIKYSITNGNIFIENNYGTSAGQELLLSGTSTSFTIKSGVTFDNYSPMTIDTAGLIVLGTLKMNNQILSTVNNPSTTFEGTSGHGLITASTSASLNSIIAGIYANNANHYLSLAADCSGTITIPYDKDIILDLSGHTLTTASGNTIDNSGILTLNDSSSEHSGSVISTVANAAAVSNKPGGTFIMNSGALRKALNVSSGDYYVIENHSSGNTDISSDGAVVINGGNIISESTHSSAIENGYYTPSQNTSNSDCTMTINDGNFIASGGLYTVKNDDYGKMTINGGSFTNTDSTHGTVLNWNNLKITGGTFNASNTSVGTCTASPSYGYEMGHTEISGGYFKGGLGTNDSYKKDITVAVTGGYFTNNPGSYVSSGYSVSSGSWESSGITYNYHVGESNSNTDNCAKNIETGVYYNTLQAAISSAGSGNTINLLKDTNEDIEISKEKNVILDLNNHILQGVKTVTPATNDSAGIAAAKHLNRQATIINNGNLTVKGNGTVKAAGKYTGAFFNNPDAAATLNQTTFTDYATSGDNQAGWYIIQNLGGMIIDGATVTAVNPSHNSDSIIINGVDQQLGSSGDLTTLNVTKNAVMIIKSGTFTGGRFCIKNGELYGELTIEDGVFSTQTVNDSTDYLGVTLSNANNSKCLVLGGTFTANGGMPVIKCKNKGDFAGSSSDQGLTIAGGTFNSVPGTTGGDVIATLVKTTSQAPLLTIQGGNFKGSFNANTEKDKDNSSSYAENDSAFKVTGGCFSQNPSTYAEHAKLVAKASGIADYPYTVGKKTVTINWSNTSVVYDGSSHTPSATASGIDSNDTAVKATITEDSKQAADAGSYKFTASLTTSSNDKYLYEIANPSCTLIIEKNPLTFTVENMVVQKGATPSLTITAIDSKSQTVANANNSIYEITYFDTTKDTGISTLPADTVGSYPIMAIIKSANYKHANSIESSLRIGTAIVYEQAVPAKYSVAFNQGADDNVTGTVSALVEAEAGTVRTLPSSGYTRSGYAFNGWKSSYDSKVYQPGETFLQPEVSVTMTAQWLQLHDITVTITQKQKSGGSENVNDAIITLWKGAAQVNAALTHDTNTNTYKFAGLFPDLYNIKVQKGSITQTSGADIISVNAEIQIELPAVPTNSIVNVSESSAPVIVSNLDKVFDNTANNEIYTPEEKAAVESGTASVTVDASVSAGAATEDISKKIENEENKAALVLDVNITKTLSPKDGDPTVTPIYTTNQLLSFDVSFPMELWGKVNYSIYRNHTIINNDGTKTEKVEELPQTTSDEGYTLKTTNGIVTGATVRLNKFCILAVAYKDTVDPVEPSTPSTPATYKVSFDANGGTGTMDAVSVTSGSDASLPEMGFTYTGHNFLTWNTAKDGSGTSYRNGGKVAAVKADVTLYAQWVKAPTSDGKLLSFPGDTRYETMEMLVDLNDYDAGGSVVIANGEGYADALAAAGFAGLKKAPIILTAKGSLSAEARALIQTLIPTSVYIAGGEKAVTPEVVDAVRAIVPNASFKRFDGVDRFDTAMKIYAEGGTAWSKQAIIVDGENYADALSIAPYAYASGSPIFLSSEKDALNEAALKAINGGSFTNAIIAGGEKAVPESVDGSQLKIPSKRFSGKDRYDTCSEFDAWAVGASNDAIQPLLKMTYTRPAVSTGIGFADALAGSAYCGSNNSVLLLADEGNLECIEKNLKDNASSVLKVSIFGGTKAVPDTVRAAVKSAVG